MGDLTCRASKGLVRITARMGVMMLPTSASDPNKSLASSWFKLWFNGNGSVETTVGITSFCVFSGFIFCNVGRGVLAFCRGFPWCLFFGRGVPGTCSGQDWIGIGKGRIRWKENKVSLSFPVFFNFPLIYICPFYRICFFFSLKKLNISGLRGGSKGSNPSKPPTTESRWDVFEIFGDSREESSPESFLEVEFLFRWAEHVNFWDFCSPLGNHWVGWFTMETMLKHFWV